MRIFKTGLLSLGQPVRQDQKGALSLIQTKLEAQQVIANRPSEGLHALPDEWNNRIEIEDAQIVIAVPIIPPAIGQEVEKIGPFSGRQVEIHNLPGHPEVHHPFTGGADENLEGEEICAICQDIDRSVRRVDVVAIAGCGFKILRVQLLQGRVDPFHKFAASGKPWQSFNPRCKRLARDKFDPKDG